MISLRLIDADKLVVRLNDLYEWCRDERRSGIEQAMCMVHDAVPVVRCEDCQHSNLNGHCMEVGKKYCTIHKRQFHYDFFCSYGERKG